MYKLSGNKCHITIEFFLQDSAKGVTLGLLSNSSQIHGRMVDDEMPPKEVSEKDRICCSKYYSYKEACPEHTRHVNDPVSLMISSRWQINVDKILDI